MGLLLFIKLKMSLPQLKQMLNDETVLKQKANAAFDKCDKNHDGNLSLKEISAVISAYQPDHTQEDIDNTLKDLDKDGDGQVDRDEFLILFKTVLEKMIARLEK